MVPRWEAAWELWVLRHGFESQHGYTDLLQVVVYFVGVVSF